MHILVRPPHNVYADFFFHLYLNETEKVNNQCMSSDTNHVLLTMHVCGLGLSGFRSLSAAFFLADPLKSVGVGARSRCLKRGVGWAAFWS